MARYKIVAHLIDPSLQDKATLTKEYLRDFNFIEKGGEEAMKLLYSKYPIDSNAYENLNSTNEFELEQDADGVYLFKRCDGMEESKKKQNTVKLNESQLKRIVAESVRRVLKEMKWDTIEGLAHDLCDGFEDTFDYGTMIKVIQQILSEGVYTLEDLWRMNNEDSNLVYDIISDYYPR